MTPIEKKVQSHVTLYGRKRLIPEPTCTEDSYRVVQQGEHPSATTPYPYLVCSPIAIERVIGKGD